MGGANDTLNVDGTAIVYCQGYFNTLWGKTAHGLVRFTRRYDVVGVVDHRYAGRDAGDVLDQKQAGIPTYATIDDALQEAGRHNKKITHLVFGIAPDGGKLDDSMREAILHALQRGLNVDCGMHTFLSEDPEMRAAASQSGATIRDVRKTPDRKDLHPFTGRIRDVKSFRLVALGTDSSAGKRTTAWKLVEALERRGIATAMIGTGQTAWLQGARYGVIMDALINDFVAGEIEHAILSAWDTERPQVMVVEGQGSLMNPIYPGGFEILAAGRPHGVIMQHVPRRRDYDGIPGTPIHPLERQIRAVELLSDVPVMAITINHEGMEHHEIDGECARLQRETGLPTLDPLIHPMDAIVDVVLAGMEDARR